jgi:hypothetical protein
MSAGAFPVISSGHDAQIWLRLRVVTQGEG